MPLPSWSQRCGLREDVRSGRLELHEFAADLNLVRQRKAPAMYQDPEAFFGYTFPSGQLKLLVRQVARRLSDLPDGKPVIRIQVAYGGGKTHTLIALITSRRAGRTAAGECHGADVSHLLLISQRLREHGWHCFRSTNSASMRA